MAESSDGLVSQLLARLGDPELTARFAIERELGAGGMGRVFAATERDGGRRVAVKLLDPLRGGDAIRFAAEAELLEQLDHPAIVAYVAHGVTAEDAPYLAMAWLDGESLSARLRRGPLAVADAVAIGARVAGALAYLHARGVLHRDIKPSNVMLVGGDPAAATVIDLGIAKQLGANAGPTATGELVGTPGYMAPEQVLGARELDGRVDLFALGCLLHEALTGASPFRGAAVMEVLARVLLHDAPDVAIARPEVPVRLARLIAALLAKRPEDRLRDATAAADELGAIGRAIAEGDERALATSPLPAPMLGDERATVRGHRRDAGAVSSPRATRRRPVTILALVAIAAIAAIAAIGHVATRADRGARVPAPATPARSPSSPVPLPGAPPPATPRAPLVTGTVIETEDADQLGDSVHAAVWCPAREALIAVGFDGRIVTVRRDGGSAVLGTIAPGPTSFGAPAIVCTAGGRVLGVYRGRTFVIEGAAVRTVDDLPIGFLAGVAVGDTAFWLGPRSVWSWDGRGPAERLRRTCDDPRGLAPDGRRVACFRRITGDDQRRRLVVEDHGEVIEGPDVDAMDQVTWTSDGRALLVARGILVKRWDVGGGAPVPLVTGAFATAVGSWLVTLRDGRLHRTWIGRGRAPRDPPVTTAIPEGASIDLLAGVPAHGEVAIGFGRGAFMTTAIVFVRVGAPLVLPAGRHNAGISALAFSPDGARLASLDGAPGRSRAVFVRPTAGGPRTVPDGAGDAPATIAWRDDGTLAFTDVAAPDAHYRVTRDHERVRVATADGTVVLTVATRFPFDRVALLDGEEPRLAVLSGRELHVVSPAGATTLTLEAHGSALAVAPGGGAIAVASGRDLVVLDAELARERLRAHLDVPVAALAFDRTGRRLAVADARTALHLFDAP